MSIQINQADIHIDGDRWVQFREGERLLYVDSTSGTTGWRWRKQGPDGRWRPTINDLPDMSEFTDSTLRTLKRSPCTRPPVDWEADQTCETCGGAGQEIVGWNGLVAVLGDRCSDCHHGKRRIAVTVPCDHPKMLYTDGTVCRAWSCDGTITVAQAVVEWGPLVVVDGFKNVVAPDCLVVADGKLWRVTGNNVWERGGADVTHWLPPNVDPQILVDQWARGGRIVEAPDDGA